MKFFAFIMAFLVLALSVMPCADTDAENDSKAKTTIAKSSQQKENPQQDDCSPFCSCTCCACFSVNHFIVSVNYLSSFSEKAIAAYLPADLIEIAFPIWQPPQLV